MSIRCVGGTPNKPMVPTAPAAPAANPPSPLRLHIGQPLGSLGTAGGARENEQRAAGIVDWVSASQDFQHMKFACPIHQGSQRKCAQTFRTKE